MSNINIDFPLYMSNVNVIEGDTPKIAITYEGDETLVDNLYLIGRNNGLSSEINEAIKFEKKKIHGRTVFQRTFPVYEDGYFQAVDEYEGNYIYEPGEAHSIVFRGKGIFLDLRKIYHLKREVIRPQDAPEAEEIKVQPIEKKIESGDENAKTMKTKKEDRPPIYDENNLLTIQPKEFRVFDKSLKLKLLQLLDYLQNEKSKQLTHDTALLPDIARSLKRVIAEEKRASVFDTCFPVVILIEKALMHSSMVSNNIVDKTDYEQYEKEVVSKIKEIEEIILETEFHSTSSMIKIQYDEDVHSLKKRFYSEF